ncbi:MAG: tRNA (guanosine(37)-N1)-methyltransferase TrmD [Acidobacteria bacterium]|uniref:tRNA (guanine-N(1)-)-methyltransferase n=1 Tax=Candidatus Polarisedimenticola svalbardensis TaxID=2886004 RepID=A0A8J7CKW0_9BACT|nr:tRNA (guanosine(37)-N1)-methyltransferase TrmD [Candidatus Polarisedimenticola svalbardensis]
MITFDVISLFPGMFGGPLEDGILARARRAGRVSVRLHDLRRWGIGKHRQVDDTPFGGGGGMVLRPEPFYEAVESVRERFPVENDKVVLLCPRGRQLDYDVVTDLSRTERIILLCGRYEGVDERVREGLVDSELSIGDFVLTGGELPAMVVIDAVSRFIPGVLGQESAAERDSFSGEGLDFPQYTRPGTYRGMDVPEVLRSGDHGAIERWRDERAREATRARRPDLLAGN